MDLNNTQRPTSSIYSRDGEPNFDNVPLGNLGAHHEYHGANIDWTLFREKQRQDRKSRITIVILTTIVALLGATAAVLGTLYGLEKSQPPRVQTKTNTSTSIVTTTTSLPPLLEITTETTTLPQLTTTLLQTITTPLVSLITETLPPVTQTTTQNQTEIFRVTTILTTSMTFTTTQTTTSLLSTTKGTQDGQRCTVDYEYGGEDLHDINSDYDLLMVDEVRHAVGLGLDLDTDDYLSVAMRSIFECLVTDALDLVQACKSGYFHDTGGVYCDNVGSYPWHSVTSSTATGTL